MYQHGGNHVLYKLTGGATGVGIRTGVEIGDGAFTGGETGVGTRTGVDTGDGGFTGAVTAVGMRTGVATGDGARTGVDTGVGARTGTGTGTGFGTGTGAVGILPVRLAVLTKTLGEPCLSVTTPIDPSAVIASFTSSGVIDGFR